MFFSPTGSRVCRSSAVQEFKDDEVTVWEASKKKTQNLWNSLVTQQNLTLTLTVDWKYVDTWEKKKKNPCSLKPQETQGKYRAAHTPPLVKRETEFQ